MFFSLLSKLHSILIFLPQHFHFFLYFFVYFILFLNFTLIFNFSLSFLPLQRIPILKIPHVILFFNFSFPKHILNLNNQTHDNHLLKLEIVGHLLIENGQRSVRTSYGELRDMMVDMWASFAGEYGFYNCSPLTNDTCHMLFITQKGLAITISDPNRSI